MFSVDRNEAFRTMLQNSLNIILLSESRDQLHKIRIGKIALAVPRHRNQPFKSLIFDNYSRSEAAPVTAMAEMVVNGVSTRKVTKVVETLCGTSISKSSVSEVCKDLDQEEEKFRNRPIEGCHPFLTVDATYFNEN